MGKVVNLNIGKVNVYMMQDGPVDEDLLDLLTDAKGEGEEDPETEAKREKVASAAQALVDALEAL